MLCVIVPNRCIGRKVGVCVNRVEVSRDFGSDGDRGRFCWAMMPETCHDRVTVAFIALQVDIGDLEKASEVTTDKDIAEMEWHMNDD